MQTLGLYLIFGGFAGVLSGLFGIGGGVIIVPFLVWLFAAQGFSESLIMIMAVATSLATITVTSIVATYAHHRHGALDWHTVARIGPGMAVGAVLGSIIADRLPAHWFKLIFAAFLLLVALRMLHKDHSQSRSVATLTHGLLMVAGTLIGTLSSILGIGGGTLSLPFLAQSGYPLRQAIALSSACGFPIAVFGTASYIGLGWGATALPAWSVGFVYLPAFACITMTSMAFAPLGVRMAHQLPINRLRRLLAVVLAIIGLRMFSQSLL
ncbi:MAG: sulfite exporter TauE/SafE family protein [Methylococcaceae bacterium]|jgi:uncharacterized membrane protein YfcA